MSDPQASTIGDTDKTAVKVSDSIPTLGSFIKRRDYGIKTGQKGAALKRAHDLYRAEWNKKTGITTSVRGTQSDFGKITGLKGAALERAYDRYRAERIKGMWGHLASFITRRDYGIKTGLKGAALKRAHDLYRAERRKEMDTYQIPGPSPVDLTSKQLERYKDKPTARREDKRRTASGGASSTRSLGHLSIKTPRRRKKTWVHFVQGGAPGLGKRA